jgi:predicted glycoside hydrolase/deacetylase ChbG (UPF0249 family)
MKIIINADDLGYSEDINDTTFSLMADRRVTSATILANAPSFQAIMRRIRDLKSCSFGVHLNLTEFESLTKPQIFYDSQVVNEHGVFNGSMRKASPGFSLLKAVEEEWAAQITRVRDAGVPISHIDSHHHIHTMPSLFLPLKHTQRRFQIKKVRTTMNWYGTKIYTPAYSLLAKKKLWDWALRNIYYSKTTTYFTSFQSFLSNAHKDDRLARKGITEIMCHPGHQWSCEETALLWSDWNRELSCELISYNDF